MIKWIPVETKPLPHAKIMMKGPSGMLGHEFYYINGSYEPERKGYPWRTNSGDAVEEGFPSPMWWAPIECMEKEDEPRKLPRQPTITEAKSVSDLLDTVRKANVNRVIMITRGVDGSFILACTNNFSGRPERLLWELERAKFKLMHGDLDDIIL